MALINCSECGKEISDKASACPNCGCPIEKQAEPSATAQQYVPSSYTPPPFVQNYQPPQAPPRKPKKPWYKRIWVWVLIVFVGLPILSGVIGGIAASETNTTAESSSKVESSSKAESKKESSSSIESSTAEKTPEEYILSALKHQINPSDSSEWSGLQGTLMAYKVTASLTKDENSTQQYRTLYYAMNWKDAYIKEFGEDSYLEEAQKNISNLITDEEIQKIDEHFAEIKQQELQDIQDYKNSAESVNYSDLIRNPSQYEGKIIMVTLNISQELTGGIITESGYAGKSNGNEWYVAYKLSDNEPRILVGDTVTFYGEFTGLSKMTRALTGATEYIPRIKAKYHA